MLHVYLTSVHVLEQRSHVARPHVLEHDDGVVGVAGVDEECLEVGGACGQDQAVGMERDALLAGQRHVRKGTHVQQLVEGGQQVVTVVVPAEAVLRAGLHRAEASLYQFHVVVRYVRGSDIVSYLLRNEPTIPIFLFGHDRGVGWSVVILSMHEDQAGGYLARSQHSLRPARDTQYKHSTTPGFIS